MNTLPAVPDTTAGDVTGRLEMLNGELVVRLRPTRVRDVTTTPVDQEPTHRHYRGYECRLFGTLRYVGPVTSELRAETQRLDAYWMDPPWWSTLRWIPSQRRLRALEKRERARPAAAQRLELERERELLMEQLTSSEAYIIMHASRVLRNRHNLMCDILSRILKRIADKQIALNHPEDSQGQATPS